MSREVEKLLTEAQGGSQEALERLLAHHRDHMFRYGLRVCRTTEDAEDAVQETLWAAARSIRSFRRAASITTWLFTIVHNYCHRLLRRGAADFSQEDAEASLVDEHPSAEEELIAHQQRRLLAAAIARLDFHSREVLLLRDIEGLTAPEAAHELGISVGALKSRLHRARTQLREQLAQLRS